MSSDIGMVGLSVMGSNLARNMASKGFKVSAYDAFPEFTEKFMAGPGGQEPNIEAFMDLKEFIDSLKSPKRVFLMIKAGEAVDIMIDKIAPLLSQGDIIIDGGNSFWGDTSRRMISLHENGILFIGTGVSGGEEGALKGPSMMPGGASEAWPHVKEIFENICAHTEDGEPCCAWVGEQGAGHFVKMVHNGIEYGDMQLICECYQFMRDYLNLDNEQIADIFEEWDKTELHSYLIEITSKIIRHKEADGGYTIDIILDTAGQKGTGMWTSVTALEAGMPVTIISEAVFARCLSAMKDERVQAADVFGEKTRIIPEDLNSVIEALRKALYAGKIMSYAQGFMLLKNQSDVMDWNLNYGGIALMWRGGCIIRSSFLGKIRDAFKKNSKLSNLMLDDYFTAAINDSIPSLRQIVAQAATNAIPMPTMMAALSFYDGYTTKRLPANLLQGQRDYFGAHTYKRVDRDPSQSFHTIWEQ